MIRPQVSAGTSAEIAVWPRPPILGTTRYDRVSAMMIAILIAMFLLAVSALSLWLANLRPFAPEPASQLIMVSLLDSNNDSTDSPLKVETPADPRKDPSVVDADESEPSAEQTIDAILNASAEAANRISHLPSDDNRDGGMLGSQDGSDRPSIGDSTGSGARRQPYQRWMIRFSDGGSLDTYARQLDHFGIELGLLHDGKIELLSRISGDRAQQTTLTSGKQKPGVMVFTWAGGARKRADMKLFKIKAGLDASTGVILHLYPAKTVQLLARLELEAAKQDLRNITRTYFSVVSSSNGVRIVVVGIVRDVESADGME